MCPVPASRERKSESGECGMNNAADLSQTSNVGYPQCFTACAKHKNRHVVLGLGRPPAEGSMLTAKVSQWGTRSQRDRTRIPAVARNLCSS